MRELKKRIENSLSHTIKNGAGFTLIEVLVVLAIIGILMGLALTSFMGSRKAARDGKRKADLEQIRSALEMCRTANVPPGYPAGIYNSITCNGQTYMSGTPKDPLTSDSYYYSATTNTYTLCAYLETGGSNCPGNPPCGSGRTCNFSVTNP